MANLNDLKSGDYCHFDCEPRKDMGIMFRNAVRSDVELILQFIKELAEYEKMSDAVVADADGWNGRVLIGTARVSISIFPWVRRRWMTGRFIASPVKP